MTPAIMGLALNGLVEFSTRETPSFRHHFARFFAAVVMAITLAAGSASGDHSGQVAHATTAVQVAVV